MIWFYRRAEICEYSLISGLVATLRTKGALTVTHRAKSCIRVRLEKWALTQMFRDL